MWKLRLEQCKIIQYTHFIMARAHIPPSDSLPSKKKGEYRRVLETSESQKVVLGRENPRK
jgi:hypothetical protein